jgi:chromosome segregation ATPase
MYATAHLHKFASYICQCTVHLLPALPATPGCLQSAQSCRDTAQSQVDASKKQVEHLKSRFSAYEQHEHELLGQLASAEAGMRGSRVTSSRLLQEGQRLESTVRGLRALVVGISASVLHRLACQGRLY